METTFKVSNIAKPTPPKLRVIGNGLALLVMALQPIISNAASTVATDKAKFWWSISLAITGVFGKVITMMFSSDENETNSDTNV